MGKLTGRFFTTGSGVKTYEIYEATRHILPEIAALLQAEFGYTPQALIDGIDVFYLDCEKEGSQITIGWDCWSGCFIMSVVDTANSEQVIREIGDFLSTKLESLGDYYDESLAKT